MISCHLDDCGSDCSSAPASSKKLDLEFDFNFKIANVRVPVARASASSENLHVLEFVISQKVPTRLTST
jgi:hypothetical protein